MTDHALYHEDCIAGMRRAVKERSVDVVVTSPPYNIDVNYGVYRDNKPRNEYLAWIREVGREIKRVLKIDGSFFLNVGNKPSDPWIAHDVVAQLRDLFELQNVIHWVKAVSIDREDGVLSVGHYKPINSERFLNDTQEFVYHFTTQGTTKLDRLAVGVPYSDKSNVKRWAGKADRRCRGNVWYVPYETIQSRDKDRPHPATFPVKLVEMCLRLHGVKKDGMVVLDPFVGLGTTCVAAARVGVSSIGFDVDARYIAFAKKRLEVKINPP